MEVLYAASKFNNRKRSSKIEVIKALNSLGFTTWNELQSGNPFVIWKCKKFIMFRISDNFNHEDHYSKLINCTVGCNHVSKHLAKSGLLIAFHFLGKSIGINGFWKKKFHAMENLSS